MLGTKTKFSVVVPKFWHWNWKKHAQAISTSMLKPLQCTAFPYKLTEMYMVLSFFYFIKEIIYVFPLEAESQEGHGGPLSPGELRLRVAWAMSSKTVSEERNKWRSDPLSLYVLGTLYTPCTTAYCQVKVYFSKIKRIQKLYTAWCHVLTAEAVDSSESTYKAR